LWIVSRKRKSSLVVLSINCPMDKLLISIDLTKLAGMQLLTTNDGRSYYGIPTDWINPYEGHALLMLQAIPTPADQYGKSHLIKPNYSATVYSSLTDVERAAIPIVGNIRPIRPRPIGVSMAAAPLSNAPSPSGSSEAKQG
jgi:hypothetical protein